MTIFTNDPKSLVVDVVGSITGETYKGVFKVKQRLSHRDIIKQDVVRRDILGKNGGEASDYAMVLANAYARIYVYLIDAKDATPGWWKDASNGMDLLDEEPVEALSNQILAMEKELNESLKKDASKAKEELKTVKID